MLEVDKLQRDQMVQILHSLEIDNLDQTMLSQMMRVLGFCQDVVFAKALFSQRIVQIYRQNQGQYQKFLAEDRLSQLQYGARCLLFTIFRLFGQQKIKQKLQKPAQMKVSNDLPSLQLPDSSNINEIIKFQKAMYNCLKHLVPNKKKDLNTGYFYPPQPIDSNAIQNFSNYALYPQRILKQHAQPPIQSRFIPTFRNPSFAAHQVYQYKDPRFLNFKTEHYPQRDSIFSNLARVEARKQESFAQFESQKNIRPFFVEKSFQKQQIPSLKGFTAFSESEVGSRPMKKVKKDSFIPVYSTQNIKNAKEQLQRYTYSQLKQKTNSKVQRDLLRAELNIKQSISEYISQDKGQNIIKQQNKQ